jgi:RNA polymerase sigma factor for flagellar operon FliA
MTKAPDLFRQPTAEPPGVSAKGALLGKNREYKPPNHQPAGPVGDRLASQQEQVLADHLPLVRFIARRVHERLPRHVPIDDLYSAGIIGLLDAFGKFDSSKNIKFRSYAQFRMRGAILGSLRNLDWSPR